ncbi:MAG: hypothetical protein COT74_13915 [Bdellovibrionales bacterium CG10_big_fil_rev_8_21_14_0_10_45_34]|nr:MAG: hypothetical protein COT74_13915 [Bdellovibrionales bacterium CG10_big_fil_rev_8_21_14_0_10_45_34]
MKKEALSQFQNPELVLLAFLLFLITFLALTYFVMRKGSKEYYQKLSQLPLFDEKGGGQNVR